MSLTIIITKHYRARMSWFFRIFSFPNRVSTPTYWTLIGCYEVPVLFHPLKKNIAAKRKRSVPIISPYPEKAATRKAIKVATRIPSYIKSVIFIYSLVKYRPSGI